MADSDNKFTVQKAFNWAIGLLLAFGSVYWATHDTPTNRAHNEALTTSATRDQEIENQKTLREKERTKQIQAASQALQSGVTPAQLQAVMPEVAAQLQQAPAPVAQDRKILDIPRGESWVITDEFDVIITGYNDNERAATILAMSQPVNIVGGEYMLVFQHDPSQRAWSNGWSSEPSPESPRDFLRRHQQPRGGNEHVDVHVRGKIRFYMK